MKGWSGDAMHVGPPTGSLHACTGGEGGAKNRRCTRHLQEV